MSLDSRLFSGGEVLTLGASAGEAVLVEGGRIVSIGEREALLRVARSREVEEIDLAGAVLMPGFVDGHNHLELSCLTQDQYLELHAPPFSSLAEILTAVAARRVSTPSGWIIVRSSFALDRKVTEGRLLEAQELDRVSPDAPVAVLAGLHVASLNSAAMEMLGLDGKSGYEPGMTVHRYPDGSPTGVFTEVWDRLPTASAEDSARSLRRHAPRLFGRRGITSVSTIPTSAADVRALQSLAASAELPFRVRFYPHVPRVGTLESITSFGAESGFGTDALAFGGIKIFVDGEGGDGLGVEFDDLKWEPEELDSFVRRSTTSGIQLFMHAVTRSGIVAAMRAVRQLPNSSRLALTAPHRIEHSGDYAPLDLLEELVASGVGIVATPHFVKSDSVGEGFQPLRELIDLGAEVIGATDSTGTVPEGTAPLTNVQIAATRVNPDGSPSRHRITVEEGLRMFTGWAAQGEGKGGKKGIIAPGALADFVVLDEHPLRVSPERLTEISVLQTFIGGVAPRFWDFE